MKNKVIQHIKDLGYDYKLSGKLGNCIDDISLIYYVRNNDFCYLDANVPHLVKNKKDLTYYVLLILMRVILKYLI